METSNKSKKNTVKLSTHLAIVTTILIGVVVLLVSIYVIMFLQQTSSVVISQTNKQNRAMATLIFKVLSPDIDTKNYGEVSDKVNNAITNGLISYVIVADNDTKMIEYSSIKNIKGEILTNALLNTFTNGKNPNLIGNQPTYFLTGRKSNATIYLGFYAKALLNQDIEEFINNMSFLVFFALLLGLILSYILTKIITKPLLSLIEGSKHFAHGDFDYRLDYFNYQELDDLVNSYNSMAETLQEMYISLETKVKERTKELNEAYKKLQSTQAMMVHSEKMKSLGELVAGITHEINNPINFVYGNLIHLTNYTTDLIKLIDEYELCEPDLTEQHLRVIKEIKQEIDLAFLKEDLSALLNSCKEGTERTKNIILDLKNFSRMEERVISSINLAKEIDTTLNILHSKLKNRVEIHKEYDENLPLVESYGGQLNQVFMNILDNAAYAIEDKGDIYIRLKSIENGTKVSIEFEDTGVGMTKEIAEKIFDPFFTTKPVGKGTGLGMSISYRVVKDHNGTIKIDSDIGKGTKFTLILPTQFKKGEQNGNQI